MEIPFDTVYLHGMIRNQEGRKISKSMPDAHKYDPLLIVDEYGADALRFTMLTGSTPGNDVKLSPTRIESNRNFAKSNGVVGICQADGKRGYQDEDDSHCGDMPLAFHDDLL